ncbi:uncharacterized protein STEHIDRAFT_135585 [Stereum hirsutum FP-91666 SS1]|uniref:Uncharacterized protein n=1 Tax=Stereum hirsutum (strain FP-91666) TaxID=721885 RepID=R7RXH8_STEHR|nr:uncharacterized protein STEHIDRAFT_135585 [Stereum hirsutum FP-91666 SS1]EIM80034.1 hypothetical protein STEHIDRAFT_135585 [Stereum hirsutum FP-91666 SS1]
MMPTKTPWSLLLLAILIHRFHYYSRHKILRPRHKTEHRTPSVDDQVKEAVKWVQLEYVKKYHEA